VMLATRSAALSDIGLHRQTNEDAFLERPPLFAVADGMGGARAGEVASSIAVDTLAGLAVAEPEAAAEALLDAVQTANSRIYELSTSDRERAGMGTTLTALLWLGDGGLIAHIGDSRAYLLSDGALRQITDDHSLVAEMVREGRMTAEQAAAHPHRSILSRALGTEAQAAVDCLRVGLRRGDVVLLCSDGLSGPVTRERIAELLALPDPRETVRRLVREARDRGGPDNITAVVVHVVEASERPVAANADTLEVEVPALEDPLPRADDPPVRADDPPAPEPRRRRWLWSRATAPGRAGAV
jgi:PPM family protein phosphatase